MELAQKSVANPSHWVTRYALLTCGLADYRTGNFQGARDWSQQALEDPPEWYIEADSWLVLAMSEMQMGQTEAAQSAVDRAKGILGAQTLHLTEVIDGNWHDWFYTQALLREATMLIDEHNNKLR